MKLSFFPFLFLVLSPTLFFAQTDYFQQEVNYDIEVSLDDETHTLSAFETIEYTNNSPDNLDFIYFHLWPNAYKKYDSALGKQKLEDGSTLMYYAEDSLLGYIDELNFSTGETRLDWDYDPNHEDICRVYLPHFLKPGESIKISTPFKVKIPSGELSRLGHIGQSYQITQWYPKPAVYDKDGWHPLPYLDQGEFYSEYGTFDVRITLPKNYVVGATGDLVNGDLELAWLDKKALETSRKSADDFDVYDLSFPESSEYNKTLHYHQKNVHDFAWFADKRYNVLKGEVELPESKRKVTTWALFTNNEADLWIKSIEYLNDATYYYSLWNGDYPYNHVTAVDGTISAGGGMEYPNVTVIGESGSDFGLEVVIMHEVGHNWFYGILGSNERLHPWMDEGLNSLNENRYIETKYPEAKLVSGDSSIHNLLRFFDLHHQKHKEQYELSYLVNARRNLDQPIETKAANYTSLNYGGIVYSKTAIAFDYLKAYLGDDLFDKCMHRYFDEWKFKHPSPSDIQAIFEQETGKKLDWFFNDLIKTTKPIDFKISGLKESNDSLFVKVKNKGKIDGPFPVSSLDKNGVVTTKWLDPIGKKSTISFSNNNYTGFKIDAYQDIPEVRRKNNKINTKGLLKTTEPLRLQLFGSLENPNKTQLFFSPIAGWNNNDKFMLGTAFYNSTLPVKKLEYVLAPMYAFGSKNFNGYANAFYHISLNHIFEDIAIGAKTSSFSYLSFSNLENTGNEYLEYYKIAPQLRLKFKKSRARQFTSSELKFSYNSITEEQGVFTRNSDDMIEYSTELQDFYVNDLTYQLSSKHPINPFLVKANIQQSKDFVRLNLEANYHFRYKRKNSGLDLRFFVGRFLYNDNASNRFNFNFSGNSDYLYEHILLARNSPNVWMNQQAMISDGGFKNYTNVGAANKWMNALNLKSTLPIKFIGLYADAGISASTGRNFRGDEIDDVSDITWGVGASLILVPKVFEVYFPIKLSSELNQLKYQEQIRFMLNLNIIKPFEMVRELDL